MTNGNWKGAWLARCDIGAGGCYSRSHESAADAMRGLKRRLKEDWGGLYDIRAALKEGIEVRVYTDGGTDSWEDDEFIDTAVLYR